MKMEVFTIDHTDPNRFKRVPMPLGSIIKSVYMENAPLPDCVKLRVVAIVPSVSPIINEYFVIKRTGEDFKGENMELIGSCGEGGTMLHVFHVIKFIGDPPS